MHNLALAKLKVLRAFVEKHSLTLQEFKPDIYGGGIDFNRPSREECLQIIRAFRGGRWEKEKGFDDDKLNYITIIDGVQLRLYGAPPPNSCRIVEELEHVPAQPAYTRVVRRVICPEPKGVEDANDPIVIDNGTMIVPQICN